MVSDKFVKELNESTTTHLIKKRTKIFNEINKNERLIKNLTKENAELNDVLKIILTILEERYNNGEIKPK